MNQLPGYELYKLADLIVQAKRMTGENGSVFYDVVLPNGIRGCYGQISFEKLATKVSNADNR